MLARNSLKRCVLPCEPSSSKLVSRLACAAQTRRRGCRSNSTGPKSTGSIFSPDENPWDHLFEDVKSSPLSDHQQVNVRSLKTPGLGSRENPRKVALTARESHVMTDIFDALFQFRALDQSSQQPSLEPLFAKHGIGRKRDDAIFDTMRSTGRRLRWTSEDDEILDRKREQMELCETDMQLLEWAMREVFDESRRYEESARRPDAAKPDAPQTQPQAPALQPSFYPHLLAQLMRTFRDKYKDPYLALSIFEHARHLSTASFVFGCTTPAFNELIETRWRCFRDLRGVCDAVEEMQVNGIEFDGRTRKLAEDIRHEVGERNLWQEETSVGSGEVWEMVARIERLAAPPGEKRRAPEARRGRQWGRQPKRWHSSQESWKRSAIADEDREEQMKFARWADQQGGLTFLDDAPQRSSPPVQD